MLENDEAVSTLHARGSKGAHIRHWVYAAARIAGVLILAIVFYGIINHSPTRRSGPKAPEFTPAVNWGSNGKTLVIFVRHGCHYCQMSHGFFERLAVISNAHSASTHILFVTPDSREVSLHDLPLVSTSVEMRNGVDIGDYVSSTPTMFLVDHRGRIAHTWSGFIPPEQEKEVTDAVF
jgi:thioredoxin-related protein